MWNQRPIITCLFAVGLLGCGTSPDTSSQPNADVKESDASGEALPPLKISPCVHPVWSTDPATLIPLQDDSVLDIEWGYQGQPMSVLGLQVEPTLTIPINISLSFSSGEVVASLYYAAKDLTSIDEEGYFFNLFVITVGFQGYIDIPLELHVVVTDLQDNLLGETTVEVSFRSP